MASASARRYARAVFELAREDKSVEEWSRRLVTLRELFDSPELRAVLDNPAVGLEDKLGIIDDVGARQLGKEGQNLAKLLIGARRSHVVGDLVEEYEALADEAAGRVRATATAAVELSDSDRRRLAQDLSQKLGQEVRLEVRVDPSILGGLVLQFGDRVIDASLRTRLQQLRRRLAVS